MMSKGLQNIHVIQKGHHIAMSFHVFRYGIIHRIVFKR